MSIVTLTATHTEIERTAELVDGINDLSLGVSSDTFLRNNAVPSKLRFSQLKEPQLACTETKLIKYFTPLKNITLIFLTSLSMS